MATTEKKPRERQFPKVEARSLTGRPYGRAGVRWSTEWTDVPRDVLEDEARSTSLREDPFIELRVDGKRIPRAGGPTDPETAKPAVDPDLARDHALLQAEHARVLGMVDDHAKAHDEEVTALKSAHADEIAGLQRRISDIESAAKVPAPSPPDPKPSDPKSPSKPDGK